MPHDTGIPHVHLPDGHEAPPISEFIDWWATARNAVDAKAAQLGEGFTGPPEGELAQYPGTGAGDKTFGRRYARCSIYYSRPSGANETHGGIRDKYDSANGMSLLGIPVTDEWATPDEVGRYNHFEKSGSIYWHPDAGPHVVRGQIRDVWAERGWEQGALGYPVADQRSPSPGVEAVAFQNGALSEHQSVVMDAAEATLAPDELLTLVWKTFDRLVEQSPDNIGLYPHRSLDSVSHTTGNFDRAHNRVVHVTINGFRDNGLAADTDWSAHLGLRLFDKAESGGYNLYAESVGGSVDADGPGSGSVSDGVANAIAQAFAAPMRIAVPPDPAQPSIPGNADFITLNVYGDGAVALLFCHTLAGVIASRTAQAAIEELIS